MVTGGRFAPRWSCVLFFSAVFLVTYALYYGIAGQTLHGHRLEHLRGQNRHSHEQQNNSTELEEYQELVRRALIVMSRRNKARVLHPRYNVYEVANTEGMARNVTLAALLNVDEATNSTHGNYSRRRHPPYQQILSPLLLGDGEKPEQEELLDSSSPYSISSSLAKAAAAVAESVPQMPTGNHPELAASMREKYRHSHLNDTNAPPRKQKPHGLLGSYFGEDIKAESLDNSGVAVGNLTARSISWGYWMADMQQLGRAPFAEAKDYKVWRNVKDYGAVGDGVTDDTAAINLAISDGQRCGLECGTSTKIPAVVYFPSGTYLVSSSIIQYYNTQFLGNPRDVPTILAASNFVGLGVITGGPFVSNGDTWYPNTANSLRSIRNFKIDIRLTNPTAWVCGIHWQAAQATSLENIEFYMLLNSDVPENNQQGMYVENGSGGFMADLIFVGGNFGANFGNQQFTTSHIVFVNCNTGVQVHWDWAWTMHDFVFEGCQTGLNIEGSIPNSKVVGSVVLVDSIIANTPVGISATLQSENATSLLVQNVGFNNVEAGVYDKKSERTLLGGLTRQTVSSWGFGSIIDASARSSFINGTTVPQIRRPHPWEGEQYDGMWPNIFTRRRPKYYDEPMSNIMNVRELGAAGDGVTDDTAVLNSILRGAANTSSIVHFPYGVYVVTNTLRVPIGSRIIGQAWSQIMGKGVNFENERAPRPVVQVARPGDVGIIEIQDMMLTVSGPTAGAVVLEWNAQEETQGSAGLWDTHIRVGGAAGSNLQAKDCPKGSSKDVHNKCKAASLLVHLRHDSTAYVENMWSWVADHDLETQTRDQMEVYAGRGILIQSRLAYLWATSSEHCVMYQYQLAGASNIFMSTIQTESPYFQPKPRAPAPYNPGIFSRDPDFADCQDEDRCAMSWAARIIDSNTIHLLGAGLYSWFNNYEQHCVETMDCQQRAVHIEQSFNIWLHNLGTRSMFEMVSPLGRSPILAEENDRGTLESLLAWLRGAEQVAGPRDFEGFHVHEPDLLATLSLSTTCRDALMEKIICHGEVSSFEQLSYRGSLDNNTLTGLVCQESCGESLSVWIEKVEDFCEDVTIGGFPAAMYARRMQTGYEETCLVDEKGSGRYCNDVINDFTVVGSIQDMPEAEKCSFCYVERLAMMQRTAYSVYDDSWKSNLEHVYSQCGLTGDTEIKRPATDGDSEVENPAKSCPWGRYHTVAAGGQTCAEIALEHTVSSASLFFANQYRLATCGEEDPVPEGTELCLPPSCGKIYVLQEDDTCFDIRHKESLGPSHDDIILYNPWVDWKCANLLSSSIVYGPVLCLGSQYGEHVPEFSNVPSNKPKASLGYTNYETSPPEGAGVAEGTTLHCGRWHVAQERDTCPGLCIRYRIMANELVEVNPSLGSVSGCSNNIEQGKAYCALPLSDWRWVDQEPDDLEEDDMEPYEGGIQ